MQQIVDVHFPGVKQDMVKNDDTFLMCAKFRLEEEALNIGFSLIVEIADGRRYSR